MNKNILGLLAIAVFLFGCEKQLNLAPISAIGDNGFYTNGEEVGLAVVAIYDGMQALPLREFALTEMRSDNAESKNREGDWAQFESYNVLPTNLAIGDYWKANYNVIFRANRVLEHLDVVEDAGDKAQYEGEALFARALGHFNMVRAFGDVPLINQVIIQTDEDFFSRTDVATVLASIDADLTAAMGLLPASLEYGRATSGAASALLAKVKLTAGDHAGAQPILADLVNSGPYSLESSYSDVFYNEGNNEVIFAISYINDDAFESQDYSYEMTALGVRAGLNYITADFSGFIDTAEVVRQPIIYSPTNPREVGKYLTTSSDNRKCGNDWIVLRHADVLLMYAESILGTNSQTADADAIAAFNLVRARASMPELVVGTDLLTKEMLSDERRVELSFENHRFYDLVRFGIAESVLGDFATATNRSFSPTDLVLPIPQGEINVSSGKLTQNPGY